MSGTHQAVIDREFIIVSPLGEWSGEVFIEEGQDKAGLGPWVLSIRKTNEPKISADNWQAVLDVSKLRFPILWRKWRNGCLEPFPLTTLDCYDAYATGRY